MADRALLNTRPGLVAKTALALGAMVVASVACELGARMLFPKPPEPARSPQLAHLYDPEIRYVMAPSQQGWIEDSFIRVNALGFRGPEVVVPKPSGRFRIVVIGDSLTLGWGVADDETYAARLERLLRDRLPAHDLDVINLGVGGFNTRQAVTWLERNERRLAPDLVLVGFYSNDVPDALEDGLSGTRVAAKNPVSGQVMRMNPAPSDAGWWDRQLRKSRALYVAGRAFNRMRGAGEWGMSRFSMEIDMLEGKSSSELERAWALVGQQFERLRSLASEGRFAVGVVVLPCKEQVMGRYPQAAFQKKVTSLARPLGFQVIDPLPLLAQTRGGADDLYIPYDRNHPSASGHRLIAEAIANYVTARAMASATLGRR